MINFQVTRSFFSFLCLYIFFIIAFGLGFYVSLNTYVITSQSSPSQSNKINNEQTVLPSATIKPTSKIEKVDENKYQITIDLESNQKKDYKFFNTAGQTLVKVSTMFSGEQVSWNELLFTQTFFVLNDETFLYCMIKYPLYLCSSLTGIWEHTFSRQPL